LVRPIAVLPESVINQIAAGEVVERPASVVKELVENALDALALEITVEISEGGKSRIAVHDNGTGMDRASAKLALERHATSKIRLTSDLATVSTLGFRGEALPSIASVSKLELLTRPATGEPGTCIRVEGGHLLTTEEAGRAPGTSVIASDLFYNVPARRKFLKTSASESRRVAALMTELALSRPEVGFRYSSEGREIFNVAPTADLRRRVAELFGKGTAAALLPLEGRLEYVTVHGFAGRPDESGAGRNRIYFFVNGRRIQDRALFHALTAAYGTYLPEGRFPQAVVYIVLPAEDVDVNVHPTKAEVRFLHPRLVYDAVYYSVNRLLTGKGAMASMAPGEASRSVTTPDDRALEHLRQMAAAKLEQRGLGLSAAETRFWDAAYRPQTREPVSAGPASTSVPGAVDQEGRADAVSAYASGRFFQLARVYVIALTEDTLVVMDQHTAHERILFEAVAHGMYADLTAMQALLFPVTVELDPESIAAFEEQADLFGRIGFGARLFGPGTVILEGAPAVLGGRSPERYFREILNTLVSELVGGRDRLSAMAASFACRAAVKSGDVLSEPEMASLFERLCRAHEPLTCPHGRPTLVRIARTELDRKFGRA
jgi:DNA mismatch repair protein MutL